MASMGARTRIPVAMSIPELEEDFPNLLTSRYAPKSPPDAKYNCIAFALGDTSHFWYDADVSGYYWPPGVPSADTLAGWIMVFSLHGYSETHDASLEGDYEKIAIYATSQAPEHVARQKASGVWISKMGKGHDIEHDTLKALEGEMMGTVVTIMKRLCKDGRRVLE